MVQFPSPVAGWAGPNGGRVVLEMTIAVSNPSPLVTNGNSRLVGAPSLEDAAGSVTSILPVAVLFATVMPAPMKFKVFCGPTAAPRSEEHTSELQSLRHLV